MPDNNQPSTGRVVQFLPDGRVVVQWNDGSRAFVHLLLAKDGAAPTWTMDPDPRPVV